MNVISALAVFKKSTVSSDFHVFLFQTFVEGHRFFEQYDVILKGLKQAAEVYVKSDSSSETLQFVYVYVYIYFRLYVCIYIFLGSRSCY